MSNQNATVAGQYDRIGAEYEKFKTLPLSKYPEAFMFMRELGDVFGRAVLDLACGTGFYTRVIGRAGASRVEGVDVSPVMIDVARRREASEPLGICYHVADAEDLPALGQFDLVTGAFLLNYAADDVALGRMCRSIKRNLSDSGEFVYVGLNPWFRYDRPNATKYGFTLVPAEAVPGGFRVDATAHVDPPIHFEIRHLRPEVYEKALHDAGFAHVEWRQVEIPQEAVDRFGDDFWSDLFENPVLIALRARGAVDPGSDETSSDGGSDYDNANRAI